MILFQFTGVFDIPCCFSIGSITSNYLDLWALISVLKLAKISVLATNDSLMSVEWMLIIEILIDTFCGL